MWEVCPSLFISFFCMFMRDNDTELSHPGNSGYWHLLAAGIVFSERDQLLVVTFLLWILLPLSPIVP